MSSMFYELLPESPYNVSAACLHQLQQRPRLRHRLPPLQPRGQLPRLLRNGGPHRLQLLLQGMSIDPHATQTRLNETSIRHQCNASVSRKASVHKQCKPQAGLSSGLGGCWTTELPSQQWHAHTTAVQSAAPAARAAPACTATSRRDPQHPSCSQPCAVRLQQCITCSSSSGACMRCSEPSTLTSLVDRETKSL